MAEDPWSFWCWSTGDVQLAGESFFLTPQRPPTSEADEDPGIAASLEDATEGGAEIAASLEDAEIAASLEDAAEDDAEIAASLEDAAEEDTHRTVGLQQLKPPSQSERSSGKRKAKSRVSQARAKTGRRARSLERSGALSGNESEIDFNEYQEVTMENVQQPVQGESVEFPGKFVRKGKQQMDDTKGQRKISLTSFFPDYNLFLFSSTAALRNATMKELTIQKRFRIKKLQSTLGDLLDHENGKWKLALEVSAQTGLRSLRLVADLLGVHREEGDTG
ncbi:unnamed protein product [Gadus morhua 'NCC']